MPCFVSSRIVPRSVCDVVAFRPSSDTTFKRYSSSFSDARNDRLDQVRQLVQSKGFQLDDTAFYTCCKSFDPDRTGDLGIPEYIALNLFLLSARNTFAAFDFQRSGVVNMNFGQFIYATANCR